MSKAYDRVNVFTLAAALARLRLPPAFTQTILRLFLPRFNQVFTAYGNSDTYLVHSGIDQGEVIFPLLWCIYYDPLLCAINDSPYRFVSEVEWCPNVRLPVTDNFWLKIPALVYMDDTLWLAKSKEDLIKITEIANSFFAFNDIQVNWSKSELLVNIPQLQPFEINYDNNTWSINAHSPKDSVRYLGV